MSNYRNIAYVDLDEGELVHFKYIKREKLPNGKWRYYYDKKAKARDKQILNDYKFYKRNYESAWNRYSKSIDKADYAMEYANKDLEGLSTMENYFRWNAAVNKYISPKRSNRELYERWGKKYSEASHALKSTPYYHSVKVKEKVEEGVKAVTKYFSDKINAKKIAKKKALDERAIRHVVNTLGKKKYDEYQAENEKKRKEREAAESKKKKNSARQQPRRK